MLTLLASAALAGPTPDLATRIKQAQRLRLESPTRRRDIAVTSFHLTSEVAQMSGDMLAIRLADPLVVGTVQAKGHGRLLLNCHIDRCWVRVGEAELELSIAPRPART